MEQGRACILEKPQVQGLFLDTGVSAEVMAWVGEDLKQSMPRYHLQPVESLRAGIWGLQTEGRGDQEGGWPFQRYRGTWLCFPGCGLGP